MKNEINSEQESQKDEGVNPSYKPYSQGNPSQGFFRSLPVSEYQKGRGIANHVTPISLTWTARTALHIFSSSTKTSMRRAW